MLYKVCNQVVRAVPLVKDAAQHERKIVPVNTKDFRYLRFRAIGNMEVAGPNGNWDGFPYEYFEDQTPGYGYRSFIDKRAHIEHNSLDGIAGSIGDLPDAYLNKFIYPDFVSVKQWAKLGGVRHADTRKKILSHDGQRQGDIEVLMRIDTKLIKSAKVKKSVKNLLDRIVRMIDTGQSLTCSMGANVEFSVCSACGNEASFPQDYCSHVKNKKGAIVIVSANELRDMLSKDVMRPEWLPHVVTSSFDVGEVVDGISNKGVAVRVSEINHKLSFFELSVVGTPAYFDAKQLEKLARKQHETRRDYLERIAQEFGEDTILDLYSFLQERGAIASQCTVN